MQRVLLEYVNYFYIAMRLVISSDHLGGVGESLLRYVEFKYVLNLRR